MSLSIVSLLILMLSAEEKGMHYEKSKTTIDVKMEEEKHLSFC
jgi:hypothetical protein